jgi:hypothetical protein
MSAAAGWRKRVKPRRHAQGEMHRIASNTACALYLLITKQALIDTEADASGSIAVGGAHFWCGLAHARAANGNELVAARGLDFRRYPWDGRVR